MLPGQPILAFLILSIAAMVVANDCAVRDRFIGVDSGNVVVASFSYELTAVNIGTSQDLIRKSVLPAAVEKTLAEKSAPLLIPGCAPAETDTSEFLDIVGIDLTPMDVTGGGRCNKKPICYTIKCKTSIYVKSTSSGVVSYYLFITASLLQNLMTGTSANQVIVFLGNFKSQTDPSSLTPQDDTLNNILFYGILIGITVCCWVVPGVCIWWSCCRSGKR